MVIGKENIKSYLPQREPFIMIDNLIEAGPEKFTSDFTIRPGNIFLEEGVLREFALIENMAQTCAAGMYVLNKEKDRKAADGFLGAITKLKLYGLPGLHQTIHTTVVPLCQFAHMLLIKGEVFLNGKKLLECELKLAGL